MSSPVGFLDDMIIKSMQYIDTSRFGIKDKIFFYKELSYLLTGWVSIIQALEVIWSSSTHYAVKSIAQWLRTHILAGKQLSYAMSRLPDYFDQGDYSIIKIGEKWWTLPAVLKSLANEYAYINDVKNKYISALLYPIILIVIAIGAVLSLFLLVLPNIFSIADQFALTTLPLTTQILKNTSEFLLHYWQYLLWWSALVWFILFIYFSTESGRRTWFTIVFSIPLFGMMTQYFYLIKWCRYMQLMLRSWLNYIQTFQLLRDVLHIPAYTDMIERVLYGLQKWLGIYTVLEEERDLIPANVTTLIKVWEQTANLPDAIENVLSMYQDELDIAITRLTKVIEPVMLLFVGGIIVVIALGVFWLILQVMEGVGL